MTTEDQLRAAAESFHKGFSTDRSPRVDGLNSLPVTERRASMRRLAAAGREMIDVMSSSAANAQQLEDAAIALESLVALLKSAGIGAEYDGHAEVAPAALTLEERQRLVEAGDAEAWANFDYSPLIGLANPMSPPLSMRYEGQRVIAEVTFGSSFEGPPSCVHGGYVAAAFDEVLGAAQALSGVQGMTANLSVNYRSPTPLLTPLRIEAWLERSEGRKIWVRGTMHSGDTLTAEATGLFIAFDPEKFVELLTQRIEMTNNQRAEAEAEAAKQAGEN